MKPLLILLLILATADTSRAQNHLLLFKKGRKIETRYWKGQFISFQPDKYQWRKGELVTITKDSFFIRPRIVTFTLFSSDTAWFPIEGYAISSIYALPKRGFLIDYKDGAFNISRTGGHVHFFWIKSGFLFRLGAAGYGTVHVINGAIKDDLSWKKSRKDLLGAAAVFLGGWLLKKKYSPVHRLGKRYHLETLPI